MRRKVGRGSPLEGPVCRAVSWALVLMAGVGVQQGSSMVRLVLEKVLSVCSVGTDRKGKAGRGAAWARGQLTGPSPRARCS